MDKIKSMLIAQLRERFKDVEVYDEPVQQDLSLPAFILKPNKATHERLTGEKMKTHLFIFLTYYPRESDDMRSEMEGIMADFYSGAWRYLGGKLHIHNLDLEHNDDVLTISFAVDVYHSMPTTNEPKMDELGGTVAVHEGDGPQINGLERKLVAK